MREVLQVTAVGLGDLLWLRLDGELDLAARGPLGEQIKRHVADGRDRLIVDARGVSFCDVAGAAALADLLEAAGGSASCVPSPAILRVARLLEWEALLGRGEDADALGGRMAGATPAEWSRAAPTGAPTGAARRRTALVTASARAHRVLVARQIGACSDALERSRGIAERQDLVVASARRTRTLVDADRATRQRR
jgi:anti-anti-sigma regulatory factor